MTMYRVLLERAAEKDLSRLSSEIHDRVIAAIQALANNPRPPGCRKLTGSKNDWRIRVGDYRVLYEIADEIRVVRVNRVRHRRDIYRWKRLQPESPIATAMSQEDKIPTAESDATVGERGILCIEDVLFSPAPLNAVVGDLFFTTKGIYLIPYRQFLFTGSFGGFASALVGGLTMAFTTTSLDQARFDGALKSAKEDRAAD